MGASGRRATLLVRFRWTVALLVVWPFPGLLSAATWEKVAQDYSETQLQLWTAQLKTSWCQRETELLKSRWPLLSADEWTKSSASLQDDQLREKLTEVIKTPQSSFVAALDKLAKDQAEKQPANLKQWQIVLAQKFSSANALSGIQTEENIVGEAAFLFSVENFGFWLAGLIALSSLAVVATYDRRHELRRRRNGGRTAGLWINAFLFGSVAIVGAIVLVLFFGGDSIYNSLVSISTGSGPPLAEQIATQIEEARQAAKAAEQAGDKAAEAYKVELERCQTVLADHKVQEPLVEQWRQSRTLRQKLDVQIELEKKLSSAIKGDFEAWRTAQNTVLEKHDRVIFGNRLKQAITASLGVLLLGTTAFGGLVIQKVMHARRLKTESTCPMCLGEGTFEDEPVTGLGAAGANLKLVRCNNIVDNNPCDFRFAAKYMAMEKLCFPTLGVPSSGKTHWLAMAYRQLQHRNYPDTAKFLRIHSPSAEDFDRIVDDILNSRFGTQATQVASIPFPLIFHFTDSDRPFESSMLVNIFDYSGEVTQRMRLEDAQRQRALNGDGYFLFLDPTKSSDEQQGPIERFQDDLYQIKNIELGGNLHTPVAICLSKIDLLNNQSYADESLTTEFYRALSEIGWGYDLAAVKSRSNLVKHMCEVIWPGWDIERQMRGLFGDRFLFFPLTPVGLNELGVTDLDQRTISPVGVLQPVLWLLHMNGYPVLKRKA